MCTLEWGSCDGEIETAETIFAAQHKQGFGQHAFLARGCKVQGAMARHAIAVRLAMGSVKRRMTAGIVPDLSALGPCVPDSVQSVGPWQPLA